jgi:hypothetical protein
MKYTNKIECRCSFPEDERTTTVCYNTGWRMTFNYKLLFCYRTKAQLPEHEMPVLTASR